MTSMISISEYSDFLNLCGEMSFTNFQNSRMSSTHINFFNTFSTRIIKASKIILLSLSSRISPDSSELISVPWAPSGEHLSPRRQLNLLENLLRSSSGSTVKYLRFSQRLRASTGPEGGHATMISFQFSELRHFRDWGTLNPSWLELEVSDASSWRFSLSSGWAQEAFWLWTLADDD